MTSHSERLSSLTIMLSPIMPQTITGTPTSRATIACQRKRFMVAMAVSC